MNEFKISLHDFRINTIIGVLPKEKTTPQEIIINLDLIYCKNPNILDYANIYNLIHNIFKENNFDYLEEALECIVDSIMQKYQNIWHLNLDIKKPLILPNCNVGVSKKVSRERE